MGSELVAITILGSASAGHKYTHIRWGKGVTGCAATDINAIHLDVIIEGAGQRILAIQTLVAADCGRMQLGQDLRLQMTSAHTGIHCAWWSYRGHLYYGDRV